MVQLLRQVKAVLAEAEMDLAVLVVAVEELVEQVSLGKTLLPEEMVV